MNNGWYDRLRFCPSLDFFRPCLLGHWCQGILWPYTFVSRSRYLRSISLSLNWGCFDLLIRISSSSASTLLNTLGSDALGFTSPMILDRCINSVVFPRSREATRSLDLVLSSVVEISCIFVMYIRMYIVSRGSLIIRG